MKTQKLILDICSISYTDDMILPHQMGAPCKRGHGGKIVGCDLVDEDKNNATLNILLTRLTLDVFWGEKY